jgi:hypothetical protein
MKKIAALAIALALAAGLGAAPRAPSVACQRGRPCCPPRLVRHRCPSISWKRA